MITFLANNFDHLNMDSLIQEKINRARAWEAAFVSFLKNYTESNDKPDFMDVAFNSERSIQDEFERTSTGTHFPIWSVSQFRKLKCQFYITISNYFKLFLGDVKVVVISYILMTIYIMLMLGKVTSTSKKWYSCDIGNYIAQKKFSLSIFGVLLVLLSVAASIGLFGLIGIPSTIVSFQVLPFLVRTERIKSLMLRYE